MTRGPERIRALGERILELTYPCSGTGGHRESVRIYGNDIDVNGTWKGYQSDDYHYITFYKAFTLESGVTKFLRVESKEKNQLLHYFKSVLICVNRCLKKSFKKL